MSNPYPLRRRIALVLITCLFLQGYPLLALQETEAVRVADEPRIPWSGAPVALDFPWPDPGPPEIPAELAEQWRTALDSVLWNVSILATSLGETAGDQDEQPVADPPSLTAGTPRIETEISDEARKAATFDNALDEIPILPGWNMISLPEIPPNTDPANLLAPIEGAYTKVIAADSCGDIPEEHRVYDSADPASATLTAIEPGVGLMIQGTTSTALPSDGELPATWSMPLCKGWNLVGLPIGQPRAVRNALASIEGKWERIFQYEADNPPEYWQYYQTDIPAWANQIDVLEPGRGFWLLVTGEDAILEIKNEGGPPSVAFGLPEDLSIITEPTEITGTVSGEILEKWTLSYRSVGETEWIAIDSGVLPVTDAPLGTFDPTLLLNGLYELRLEATDYQNRQVETTIAVSVEGNMKIGNFTLSFVDLAIPFSGLDIEVIRTYDSRQRQDQGDFGQGWTLDIRQGSYRNNRPPGDGWQFETGFLPCDSILETKSHLTVVRLSDQEVYRFRLTLSDGASTQGGCFADAGFEFVDGPLPGSTLEIIGNSSVFYENGGDRVLDAESFEIFEPDDVRLATRDGRIFDLDLTEGVTRLADLNGNELQITPEGITHSSGRGIQFERDEEGRISKITDPSGHEMRYFYTATGDLSASADSLDHRTIFLYDEDHFLVEILDPRGVQAVRSTYDRDGRLVEVIDALGQKMKLQHDLDARREVVTNRLGFARILEYDRRGNIVAETDELGHVTRRTYDAEDRLLTETDPLGNTTRNEYDNLGDLLAFEDALGNRSTFTYDPRGNLLRETDGGGVTLESTYDKRGNQITTTSALGSILQFQYDTNGNVISETDASGATTRHEYDAQGRRIRTISSLGVETFFTYNLTGNLLSRATPIKQPDGTTKDAATFFNVDAAGRTISTTYPDGTIERKEYTSTGKIYRSTDTMGRLTMYLYDLNDRLIQTSFPDGTSETRDYDAEGNLTSVTNREGRQKKFLYNAAGHQVATIFSDSTKILNSFDAAGRISGWTDEAGNKWSIVYDAAGRPVSQENPLGHRIETTYDAGHRPISFTNANGHQTNFKYNQKGQIELVTLPDLGTYPLEYDAVGHRTAFTDPLGNRHEMKYNGLGQLVEAQDPVGSKTEYQFNELGKTTSVKDANGNVTRFRHDAIGRLVRHTMSDGLSEILEYDQAGNVVRKIDVQGREIFFKYDLNDRLVERSTATETLERYTYTPEGQRSTVEDNRGVTRYTYDLRNRFKTLTYPDGNIVSYDYDSRGNVTSLEVADEANILVDLNYRYDAANRLISIEDKNGEIFSYKYDAAGNISEKAYPNSVTERFTHDSFGRLLEKEVATAEGKIIDWWSLKLDDAGRRVRLEESDGAWTYRYDKASRLISESFSDISGMVNERTYVYDPVGNRTHESIYKDGIEMHSRKYFYDSRDRLVSAGSTTFEWDSSGNLTRTPKFRLAWDIDNRLTEIQLDSGEKINNYYDTDGVLVKSQKENPSGLKTSTRFIVDASLPVSQVLAEIDDLSNTVTTYVRGHDRVSRLHDLLAISRSEKSHYAHSDPLMSIRLLTDHEGQPITRYSYSAFGSLVGGTEDDTNQYRFAGEFHLPAANLYYNRARWLVPDTGRWASSDPWPGDPAIPRTLHDYAYVGNNPVNAIDPLGLFEFTIAGLTVSLGAQSAGRASQGARAINFLTRGLRNKQWDLFFVGRRSNVHWLIPHFYIFAEQRKSPSGLGLRYDVGPNNLSLGGIVRGPGQLTIRPESRLSALKGAWIKIAPHNKKQFAMWNAFSVASAFFPEAGASVDITYGFFGPFVGQSCLSWTLGSSVSAYAIQFFPVR